MRFLILRSYQSPGDILMLSAAIRELHTAHPGQFQTDVRTSADALWEHNPRITKLSESDPQVEVIDMHYPLVHQSQSPYHFTHGYVQFLEKRLGISIFVSRFGGEVFLDDEERQSPFPGIELPEKFWIIVAGGKHDFTAKWWNPASYQQVVNHFAGKIAFVQCGEAGHWHPPLSGGGVINLVGKTSLRQFVRLMHHASGVVCPVTFAMHLAVAVETRRGRPKIRPCVVIAGGREPPNWEAYPQHQYISTVGSLSCGLEGCWKSRCQLVGDGDEKDRRNVCEQPVQLTTDLRIPLCMNMITPQDVIRRIELYLAGDAYSATATAGIPVIPRSAGPRNGHSQPPTSTPPIRVATPKRRPQPAAMSRPVAVSPSVPRPSALSPQPLSPPQSTGVGFYHGLGDGTYFAHVTPLYIRRGHRIEVECTPDKRIIFEAAGARVIERAAVEHPWGYPAGGTYVGHGQFWQGSKIGHNISEPPLPNIGPKGELWDELCASRIDIRPHLSAGVVETAREWLARLPRPRGAVPSEGEHGAGAQEPVGCRHLGVL